MSIFLGRATCAVYAANETNDCKPHVDTTLSVQQCVTRHGCPTESRAEKAQQALATSLARLHKKLAYVSVPRFRVPSPGSGTRASCSASASPKFLRGTPSAPGGSGSVLTARATSSSVICVLDLSQTFASNHLTKKRKKRHSKGLQLSGHRRKCRWLFMTPSVRECVLVLCSIYSKGGSALSGNPRGSKHDAYLFCSLNNAAENSKNFCTPHSCFTAKPASAMIAD